MKCLAAALFVLINASPAVGGEVLFTHGPQQSRSPSYGAWADLAGFEMTDQNRRLWDPVAEKPDWARAERSSQYAGIALSKVQRWLREMCLPIRDERSGLFRSTGPVWNYSDTAADCYPFYVWAAFYTDKQVLSPLTWSTTRTRTDCGTFTSWKPTRSARY